MFTVLSRTRDDWYGVEKHRILMVVLERATVSCFESKATMLIYICESEDEEA